MKNILLPLLSTFFIASSFYSFKAENESIILEDSLVSKNNLEESKLSSISNNKSNSADIYSKLAFDDEVLNSEVFEKAYQGFNKLKDLGEIPEETNILTICDYSLSSNTKRMWVIDVKEHKVLFNTLVAHGKNTGEEFAENFSNTESSLQSSMGFFITDDTYFGENGYSLKLHGKDVGFNDAALKRLIVMHGADYVSSEFAAKHKRIGRSWGCPAVPRNLAEPIINTIKNKTVLFIYYPKQEYLSNSVWLNS